MRGSVGTGVPLIIIVKVPYSSELCVFVPGLEFRPEPLSNLSLALCLNVWPQVHVVGLAAAL